MFHDVWNAKFPWAKSVVDVDGKVKCKVCSKIEGKENLLAPKLDSLWKHCGRRKTLTDVQGVCKAGEYYMNKNFGSY
jgi:hypothetical protein